MAHRKGRNQGRNRKKSRDVKPGVEHKLRKNETKLKVSVNIHVYTPISKSDLKRMKPEHTVICMVKPFGKDHVLKIRGKGHEVVSTRVCQKSKKRN